MPDKKKSPFDLADEQAARQRARDARGPSKPPKKGEKNVGSHIPNPRNTRKKILDKLTERQTTDSNN
jgi:hypothetical protein